MSTRAPQKIETLEGLRALAVILVIVEHALPPHELRTDYFRWWWPGPGGVRLFFVLSGFLITGILLRARKTTDDRAGILRGFYARRALRIVPLAYLALAVGIIFDVPDVRSRWPWYAGFAINVRQAWVNGFDASLGHLWSLAVEEQFYLMWPWLVLWTPRHVLPRTLSVMIGAAVIIRLAFLLDGQQVAAYVLMPTRLDALAAGALLACWVDSGRRPPSWCWAAGIGCVAIGGSLPRGPWASSAMEGGMVVLSLMTVDYLRDLKRGVIYRVMTVPVAQYLGSISYGLYVWHALLPRLIFAIELQTASNLFLPRWQGLQMLLYLATVSVIVASLSWYLLERPVNNLKHRFPYVRRRPDGVARAS